MSSFCYYIKKNLILATIEQCKENKKSSLNLSNSEIKNVPSSIFKLKDLTKLYLNNNEIKQLPEEIINLKHLKVLALDYNLFHAIPPEIGKLNDLVCLNLSYNNLNHLIPEIGNLSKLEVLWLNKTNLKCLPPEIGKCTYLDTLGARGNFLKKLPPEIGALHRLRWLTLESNFLSDLPEEVMRLESLIHLNLSDNEFEKLPNVDKMKQLKFVFLSRNHLTQPNLQILERLSYVREIDLSDNPIINVSMYENLTNLKFNSHYFYRNEAENTENSDTESEDWQESAPTSDLDLTDSSVENLQMDEILEGALPQVVKFASAGII